VRFPARRRHHPAPIPPAATLVVVAVLVLSCLLPAVLAPPAAASSLPRHAARDKDDHPQETPPVDLPRVALDCSSPDSTLAVTVASADTLSGDTTGGTSQAERYSCVSWTESGPERMYRLDVSGDVELRASLSDLGANDLDLFLLDACDTDACIAHANRELVAWLSTGTYYLMVDGYRGAQGSYTLALTGRYPGVPPEICEPGGTDETYVPTESGMIEHSGNLFGKPNRIQTYTCSEVLEAGGEFWYAITLPDSGSLSVDFTTVADSLDVALWLFDGCGTTAECLGFADDRVSGQPEQLEWENLTGGTATVYMAVDCFRPPSSEFNGDYTLGLDVVPTEQRSLSGIKALFRGR